MERVKVRIVMTILAFVNLICGFLIFWYNWNYFARSWDNLGHLMKNPNEFRLDFIALQIAGVFLLAFSGLFLKILLLPGEKFLNKFFSTIIGRLLLFAMMCAAGVSVAGLPGIIPTDFSGEGLLYLYSAFAMLCVFVITLVAFSQPLSKTEEAEEDAK